MPPSEVEKEALTQASQALLRKQAPHKPGFFPGGLRAQLLLILIGMLLGTLALVAIVFIRLHTQSQWQTTSQHTRILCATLASIATQGSQHTLERAHNKSGLTLTTLFAHKEATISFGDKTLLPDAKSALLAKEPFVARTQGLTYVYAAQVINDHHTLVVAKLWTSSQDRLDATREALWVYFVLTTVFVSIIGYALLTFMIVRPIRAIGVATLRASNGDLASPISRLPVNEFGLVGHQFNIMLERLESQRITLQNQLTELKHTQDSLIQSEKLASVGHLAAGVAHEVGNPLAAILAYVDLLSDEHDDEMRKDMTSRIQTQLQRIQHIIQELLRLSRDDSDQKITTTDLHMCVHEAVDLVRTIQSSKAVEIKMLIPTDIPKVQAVHSQVVQVLINLLFNAIDAIESTAQGSRIILESHIEEHSLVLNVCDDGPGIPEQARTQIFDPFFTTKPPGEGTGLGLSICLRIMQRFGGDLRLGSAKQGASFVLSFRI